MVKSQVDFVSVLYNVLISWLKVIGLLILVNGIFLALSFFLQKSVNLPLFFKDIFASFLAVTMTSSILFMPYLFLQAEIYKSMIISSKIDFRKSILSGAIVGFVYGTSFLALLILGVRLREASQIFYVFPLFGTIAGGGLGYFVFPRFENKYYPWSAEKTAFPLVEGISNCKEDEARLAARGELGFTELIGCVFSAFLKSIFWTVLCGGVCITIASLIDGEMSVNEIGGAILLILLTLSVGVAVGVIVGFPAMIGVSLIYSWLYKKCHTRLMWWMSSSLLVGQVYVLILYAIDGDHFLVGLSKFFYIPVSLLTGYFSWKQLHAEKRKEPLPITKNSP